MRAGLAQLIEWELSVTVRKAGSRSSPMAQPDWGGVAKFIENKLLWHSLPGQGSFQLDNIA